MKLLIKLFAVIFTAILFVPLLNPEAAMDESYRIGVNDIISVKVIGHKDLDVLATVAADGSISFPYLGSVYVKDKTLDQVKEEVTSRLAEGYIKSPVVLVSLVKTMSKRIFIRGEVAKVGAIPFEKDLTIVKALSLAGGIREDGLYGVLKLRREKKKYGYETIIEAELNNGIILDKKIEDTFLQPEDILIVERNETFLIQGEVAKRGRFILEKDKTVLQALIEAGGVTTDGLYGTLKLRRKKEKGAGGYKTIVESSLNMGRIVSKEAEDTILKPDDILIVERNETFLTQGEIAQRGRFVLEKDMTVLRALLQAGGVTDNGRYGKIKIRRKGDHGKYYSLMESILDDGKIMQKEVEDTLLQPDDILIIEKNETFLTQGEIAQRGRFALEKEMTVLRALLQAGGVTDNGRYGKIKIRRKGETGEYATLAESNLNNGRIVSTNVENTILQPDDILIIEPNRTFFIYGEVNKTGEFVLKENMTVFKAITIAGGLTKWGSEGRIVILRKAAGDKDVDMIKVSIKDVLKGDIGADVLLQEGDTIIAQAAIL